jgi:MFS family permease
MADVGVTARGEWRAHWGLVLAAMLGTAYVAVPTIVLGQFIPPLQAEFGWSRSELSAGLTILALISTPLGPFAGGLADRFGSRAVAVPGLLISALVYAGFGFLTGSIALWLVAWTAYALVSLSIRSMVWTRAASNAFTASRGLALAVILSGTSVGQVVGPVIAQWLIAGFGWRIAFIALGLGWGGLAFLIALLLFHEPRAVAPIADHAAQAPELAAKPGLTLGQALRDWRILRIAFAVLMMAIMSSGFMVHLFPLLTGARIAPVEAASMVGALGISGLVGQFVTGWLVDRMKGTLLPVLCFVIPAGGYLLMLAAGGSEALLWLGVLLIGYGGGAAINVTVFLVPRYAGLAHFGKIYGVISSCLGLGAGIGAMLAGASFDATGSYDLYLIIAAVALGLGALAHFRLPDTPRFDIYTTGKRKRR